MKKKILLLLALCVSSFSFSQGQITGVIVDPASPTNADYVKVYVNLSFSSGSCEPDYSGSSTNGNTTTASALHCLGALTVICSITDTFDLGYLQAGSHQFSFTLSSGFGGPGCSPGIVPDDDTTFSFTVSSGLGVTPIAKNNLVHFFPNPMATSAVLKLDPSLVNENLRLTIVDASGRIVFSVDQITDENILLNNLDLANGIYFYQLNSNQQLVAVDKIIVEK